MARIKSKRPLVKVTIRLHEGQLEDLARFYPTVPYNTVIRMALDKMIRRLEERASHAMADMSLGDATEIEPPTSTDFKGEEDEQ